MALHIFVAGESALVAENLNGNFQSLLSLIQGSTGTNIVGTAAGSSTTNFVGRTGGSSSGSATGIATVTGVGFHLGQNQTIGNASGTSTSNVVGAAQIRAVGAATGTAGVFGFNTTPSVFTATGTSSTNFISNPSLASSGIAAGTSTATGAGARNVANVGTATGFASVNGVGAGGPTESVDGTVLTQPTQVIFASTTPGQASTSLNSFSLTAQPGVVTVNGVNDTTTTGVTELFYTGHVLYRENIDGSWFRWVSAGNWAPASDPTPQFISESVEGFSLNAAGVTMFSSATPGTAAPAGASVANGGLQTWGISANPGVVIHNGVNQDGTGGSSFTQNVIQLYYHNHTVFQNNTSGLWWSWDGANWQPPGGTTTSPVPVSPTINVALIPSQINVNTTFVVKGTYQAFPGTGNPTLQYADNVTATQQAQSTTWNSTDKSASITLSNANIHATSSASGSSGSVRSTTNFATGKKIFEISSSPLTFNWCGGVANATFNLASGLGDDGQGVCFQPANSQAIVVNGAIVASATTDNTGGAITFCFDFGAKLFWVTSAAMRAAGNAWNHSSTASPASGTGGISFTTVGPYYVCWNEFDSGGGADINTLGPFSVGIPLGFSSWDVSSGATTWLSFPSNVNVTPTTWSFVHPPVPSQNPTFSVSVRDAVNTGVIGTSNTFQIQVPGVTTLNPMTIDNTTFTAGTPAGTIVGNVTVPTSGGAFIGTIITSDSRFQVTGSGNTQQLVTTAVLSTGSFPLTLTALQANAINNGETLNITVTGVNETPQATSVTSPGPTIVGSSQPGVAGGQLTWALTTGGRLSLNNVTQNFVPTGGAVVQLYYISHNLYIATGSLTNPVWQVFTGTLSTGAGAVTAASLTAASFTSTSTPIPNITLSSQTFQPNTNGPTGITASLISATVAMPNVTWAEDSPSFNFVGNALSTTGALPAGSYPINVTATIPN